RIFPRRLRSDIGLSSPGVRERRGGGRAIDPAVGPVKNENVWRASIEGTASGDPFRVGSRLLHHAGLAQAEARDRGTEHAAGGPVHLVGAFHRADRSAQNGAARVLMRLTALEDGLLADDAGTLDLFDLAVAVGDDPVTPPQLDACSVLV